MTRPSYGGVGRTSVEELEAACKNCGHQNAVHTGGSVRPPGPATNPRTWAIWDKTWSDATGRCAEFGCDCKRRR